jgi:RHS repeat-associated protein
MTSDGNHAYTYDADGNLTKVDNGTFVYNALNQRVKADYPWGSQEYTFGINGKRVASWDSSTGNLVEGVTYWGDQPVEFYSSGYAHFPHADWLGTTRSETTNSGAVDGAYSSLPFGDGWSNTQATLYDAQQFAGMDWDSTSNEHAQYREYSNMAGRWLSPDPYGGSYDMSDPQSFNRYAYVQNNPMSATEPSGLMMCNGCGDDRVGGGGWGISWGGAGGSNCSFFLFFCWRSKGSGAPKQPPIIGYKEFEDYNSGNMMNEHLGLPPGMQLPTGGLIDLFGINAGCEFGACGNIAGALMPGSNVGMWACGIAPSACRLNSPYLAQILALLGSAIRVGGPSSLPSVPRPYDPILEYANCSAQVRSHAEKGHRNAEIMGGIGLGDAAIGCAGTGPFWGQCEGGIAALELLYLGVNYGAREATIWQGETACMQR